MAASFSSFSFLLLLAYTVPLFLSSFWRRYVGCATSLPGNRYLAGFTLNGARHTVVPHTRISFGFVTIAYALLLRRWLTSSRSFLFPEREYISIPNRSFTNYFFFCTFCKNLRHFGRFLDHRFNCNAFDARMQSEAKRNGVVESKASDKTLKHLNTSVPEFPDFSSCVFWLVYKTTGRLVWHSIAGDIPFACDFRILDHTSRSTPIPLFSNEKSHCQLAFFSLLHVSYISREKPSTVSIARVAY